MLGLRRGQSLTGLTVAVFIILMALTAIATLVTVTVRGQRFAEETVIAGNLAREGIEVARMLRDNSFTTGFRPSTCTDPCSTLPSGQSGSDHDGTTETDPSTGGWAFNYNGSGGDFTALGTVLCLQNNVYFQRNAGCPADTATRFRRRVTVDFLCLDADPTSPNYNHECVATAGTGCPGATCVGYTQFVGHRVRSRVSFPGRSCSASTEGCIVLEDYLYAWK